MSLEGSHSEAATASSGTFLGPSEAPNNVPMVLGVGATPARCDSTALCDSSVAPTASSGAFLGPSEAPNNVPMVFGVGAAPVRCDSTAHAHQVALPDMRRSPAQSLGPGPGSGPGLLYTPSSAVSSRPAKRFACARECEVHRQCSADRCTPCQAKT